MPGLLYIKTFGCQMNEYDSSKSGLLEATHGMTRTDNPAESRRALVNTCSVREKAQEKFFPCWGVRLLKRERPHVVIRGRLPASQEGDGSPRGAVSSTWYSDPRRCIVFRTC